MMSFREHPTARSSQKNIRRDKTLKAQHWKNLESSPPIKDFKLFDSRRLLEPKNNKETDLNGKQKVKIGQKVFTTDESNNGQDSNLYESVQINEKFPNDQYFQQPLNLKSKKLKTSHPNRQTKNSKIEKLNKKLEQMNNLVRSQDKELKQLKSSMSERQLHRLLKMHSIEKLKLLQTVNVFKNASCFKNTKKG